VLVLLTLVPSLALVLHTEQSQRQHEVDEVRQDTERLASMVSIEEQWLVEDTRDLLVTLARLPALQPGRTEDCRTVLGPMLAGLPRYTNFGVADPTGRVVCSAMPASPEITISDRDYFRGALQTGTFSVGGYQIGRITHRPAVNMAHPIRDGEGSTVGILFAALDLDVVGDIEDHARASLPEGSVLVQLDREGRVLSRQPRDDQGVGQSAPELTLVPDLIAAGTGTGIVEGADGVERIFAVTTVASRLQGEDLRVLLEVPAQAAFAHVAELRTRSLAWLALVTVGVLTLAWFLARELILQPIDRIVGGTRRLAEGDVGARIGPPYAAGELGELARSFDRMAEAIGTRQDERDEAMAALQRSEEAFRSAVHNAPYGIMRTTPDGRILKANPAMVEMLGYDSEAELCTRHLPEDLYPDPAVRPRLLARHEADQRLDSELTWKRKDGGLIDVRTAGRRVVGPGGEMFYEVFVEDVTEQRALEQQFLQAQKMEAVGLLAGGVAHDFNNLLTVILTSGELLLEQVDGAQDEIEAIIEAGQRASALTRQLLVFSRRDPAEREILDLDELVSGLEKMLRRLLGEDVTLETHLAGRPLYIEADKGRIEQIVMNLVVNARDAMPEGGTLVLETRRVAEPDALGASVEIVVRDNGEGMDRETQQRMFEPFFTTKRRGTGLGLSTVYGIVNEVGGHIEVRSRVGEGTTFVVNFPETADPVREVAVYEAEGTHASGAVLIIEDDEALRRMLCRFLRAHGLDVYGAESGEAALGLVTSRDVRPDLLLADVVLPGMSGRAVADALRERWPDLRVLYMSGYTDDAVIRRGVQRGRIAFLQKPFSLSTLLQRVRTLLEDAGS